METVIVAADITPCRHPGEGRDLRQAASWTPLLKEFDCTTDTAFPASLSKSPAFSGLTVVVEHVLRLMTVRFSRYLIVAATCLGCVDAHAQGYIERLTAAEPAAAALLVSKARDWRAATEIVKDRAAFMIFTKPFPKKSKMSPNDLIACLDEASDRAQPDFHMGTIIRGCTQ